MTVSQVWAAAFAVAGIVSSAAVGPALASSDWPTREVNVIIPWAAGGGTDPLARIIFDDLSQRLGQAFVLDFRPGAAGTIGANTASKADPDGYTMLFTSGAPAVNANFMPNVEYDPKTDILPVAQVTYSPTFITANAKTPYNTFQELIDYAKANPGKVNAAFSGIGGNSHLAVTTVQYKADVQFNVVPYTGAGAQQADLMSGVVDLGFGFAAGFMPGVKAGKLKYIAAMAEERDPLMPDVPATDESDYKGVYKGNWFMAFVPKGTPREIVDRMNAELRATLANPDIQKRVNDLGYEVVIGTPEDAAELIRSDIAEMQVLVDAGVFQLK
ncbi:Bug family tripartite tricarboxylate transporter substrate binding protein [Faunimonas sp. B44]|uniref:Bug family tripartite tricarboxylate transporter substrate binding protein n=1 Tax=Faunimonas sp. B44 TaxID=3461493 RepID=UPI00404433D2